MSGVRVVGFDLDLTLIDTGPAIAAMLRATSLALGASIDVGRVTASLGPPLEDLLAEQLPRTTAERFAARYRAEYAAHGAWHARLLPGAREALTAVRRSGDQVIVVTGQSEQTARAHLAHERLEVAAVVGGVWGPGKAEALLTHRADTYVGDHPADIAAARAAGARAVAVTTGRHPAGELVGADLVLNSLLPFPAWWAAQTAETADTRSSDAFAQSNSLVQPAVMQAHEGET